MMQDVPMKLNAGLP